MNVVTYMTKKKFITWLKSKHPRTKVGTGFGNSKHRSYSCPAARYLQVQYPEGKVRSLSYYCGNLVGGGFSSPKWLKSFVNKVDAAGSPSIITAKKALEFLGEKE